MTDFLDKYSFHKHQGFILSSIFFAIFFIGFFFLEYNEYIKIDFYYKFYHSYSIIFFTFTPFIVAVTLMSIPMINKSFKEFNLTTYRKLFYPFIFIGFNFIISLFSNQIYLIVTMTMLLFWQIYFLNMIIKFIKIDNIKTRDEIFWITISFGMGILSNLAYIIYLVPIIPYNFEFKDIALNIALYPYLFISFAIFAQKFILEITENSVEGYKKDKHIDKNLNLIEILFLLSIFHILLIFSDYKELIILSDILILFILTDELKKWDLSYLKVENNVWSLYTSLVWLVIAFIISSFTSLLNIAADLPMNLFNSASEHALVLGFFGTFYLSFGTRMMHKKFYVVFKDTYLNIFLTYSFQTLILIVVTSELGLEYQTELFGYMFDLSAFLWISIMLLWLLRYSHRLYYIKLNQSL